MKKAERIKLFAFDVDGTLTPGYLVMGENGETSKIFHARDGLAIALAIAWAISPVSLPEGRVPLWKNGGKSWLWISSSWVLQTK